MARLANGTRRRSDGTLEKRFTINRRRYSVYGKTVKELTDKELQLRKQIEAGLYNDNRRLTLDSYFKEWLVTKRATTKGNTLKTYKSCYYKHISPILGEKKVQAIERREVIQLQSIASECLASTTCNAVLRTLKIILNDAVRDEVINRNPAEGVKSLKATKEKATKTIHRALTEQEQEIFMSELKGNFYYEFIALLLTTGMRFGEAAALQWHDIDYKQNVIYITKTLTFSEEGQIIIGTSPKSEAGKREIPMNDTIKEILKTQKKKFLLVKGSKILHLNDCIFFNSHEGVVKNHAINRAIKQTLDSLEQKGMHIEPFTAHALRDTFATRYIEQGGNMQTLKTILGHSSLSMTMDLYSHVLPNTKQKEMNNLTIVI